MKILYVEPIRLPTEKAHGIQIMEMCAAFKRRGADVELVVSDRKTPIAEDPFEYYNVRERFTITRLPSPDLINFGPIGFWLFLVIFAMRALRYARLSGADIVYTRTPAVAKLFSKRYRGAIVWEVHARHTMPRKVLEKLSLVVPITHGLSRWYETQGVPSARLHVAPDGVNLASIESADQGTARAQLRERLGLARDSRIALYLGSFGVYAWKGVDIARAAAEKLPDVTWLFVGGSPEECETLLRDAPKNVRVLPRAKRSEVPGLLAAVDVLLLPNKSGNITSEEDTSPLKLFEYMGSGVPIVASDLPSIREVLDADTGYFATPNDPGALAHAVESALQDDAQARAKAAAARKEVESFTWDKRAEGILAAIMK